MWPEALQYLACPHCHSELYLEDIEGASGHIEKGILHCSSGCGSYPVHNGVPQLLPELYQRSNSLRYRQKQTRHKFSSQWGMFRYGTTTWGTTTQERVVVALHELGWDKQELRGKIILDAGCGNGTLSKALDDLGAIVVATDLSGSVFRAQSYCGSDGIHFAQANLFYPPFKLRVFDAIYSCGVFHHTPSPKRCFHSLVPHLKTGADSRYFVWLYEKRAPVFNVTVEPLMKLTRRMPRRLLASFCLGIAPGVEMGSRVLCASGIGNNAPRSVRDRAVTLHDLLSPPYVSYHSFEEAKEWAQESSFRVISKCSYNTDGHSEEDTGMVLNKYVRLCRPGFGMLCRGLPSGSVKV